MTGRKPATAPSPRRLRAPAKSSATQLQERLAEIERERDALRETLKVTGVPIEDALALRRELDVSIDLSFSDIVRQATQAVQALRSRLSANVQRVRELQGLNDTVVFERAKLSAFKTYVHERLDAAGVPADPEPEANAIHGCRIEGRLNFVLNRKPGREAMELKLREALRELLSRVQAAGALPGNSALARAAAVLSETV